MQTVPDRGFRLPAGSREHVIGISPPDPLTGKSTVTFRAKGVVKTVDFVLPSPFTVETMAAFEKRVHDHVISQNA